MAAADGNTQSHQVVPAPDRGGGGLKWPRPPGRPPSAAAATALRGSGTSGACEPNRTLCDSRVSRTLKEDLCRRSSQRRCCARDGGLLALQRRPSGAGAKPPDAALAEDCRGERSGKGRARPGQVGTRKTFQKAPGSRLFWVGCALLRRRNGLRWHRNRGSLNCSRDEPGGCPCSWPGGVRRRGGVSLVCGSRAEREKACC